MKNKLKQQLRDNLLSHLSDYETKCNVDVAYVICKNFSLRFVSFLRENYSTEKWDDKWKEWLPMEYDMYRCLETDKKYTTEELLNKFLDERNAS